VEDLSHIWVNSDQDEAQDFHDQLPDEVIHHLAAGALHAAHPDKYPHPGLYRGPRIQHGLGFGEFPDAMEATDTANAREMEQHQAIENIASCSPPVIPAPMKQPAKDVAVPPIPGAPTGQDGDRTSQIAGGNATAQTPRKKSKLPAKNPDFSDL
jgi:hypothetical protein